MFVDGIEASTLRASMTADALKWKVGVYLERSCS